MQSEGKERRHRLTFSHTFSQQKFQKFPHKFLIQAPIENPCLGLIVLYNSLVRKLNFSKFVVEF